MSKLKSILIRLNESLTGFRGILTLWGSVGVAYIESVLSSAPTFSMEGLKTAALLNILPTLKLIVTDVMPKMKQMYIEWLAKP